MVGLQRVDHRSNVGLRFGGERLNARQQAGLVDLTGPEARYRLLETIRRLL